MIRIEADAFRAAAMNAACIETAGAVQRFPSDLARIREDRGRERA
ncbi:hypothetical protein [Sphingomonas panacis]|nr:hypothetical protein [Sphingomonas panacis]